MIRAGYYPARVTTVADEVVWTIVVGGGGGRRFGAPKQYERARRRPCARPRRRHGAPGERRRRRRRAGRRRRRARAASPAARRAASRSATAWPRCPPRPRSCACTTPPARWRRPSCSPRVVAAVRAGADGAVPAVAGHRHDQGRRRRRRRRGDARPGDARRRADAAGVPGRRRCARAHAAGGDGTDDAALVEARRRPRRDGARRAVEPQDHRARRPRVGARAGSAPAPDRVVVSAARSASARASTSTAPATTRRGRWCSAGAAFPGVPGLVGHSDGDAVAHAVAEALLGAAGLGDIGQHFPDTDPSARAAPTRSSSCAASPPTCVAAGWSIGNADCSVVCERPRLAPMRDEMQARLSAAVGAPVTRQGPPPRGPRRARSRRGHRRASPSPCSCGARREPGPPPAERRARRPRWRRQAAAAAPAGRGGRPAQVGAGARRRRSPGRAARRDGRPLDAAAQPDVHRARRRAAAVPGAPAPVRRDGDGDPHPAQGRQGPRRRAGRGPPGRPRAADRRAPAGARDLAVDRARSAPTARPTTASPTSSPWPRPTGCRSPTSPAASSTHRARSEAPQGVIAFAAPLPEAELADLVKRRPGRPPFLVAIDGVTDPGNLGAIIRSCDGAGVHGVLVPRHRAVHVTPTVAKASAGADRARADRPRRRAAGDADAGCATSGSGSSASTTPPSARCSTSATSPREGICLVLGAEGAGLSRLVRERCDLIVSIPMRGRISSLNVVGRGRPGDLRGRPPPQLTVEPTEPAGSRPHHPPRRWDPADRDAWIASTQSVGADDPPPPCTDAVRTPMGARIGSAREEFSRRRAVRPTSRPIDCAVGERRAESGPMSAPARRPLAQREFVGLMASCMGMVGAVDRPDAPGVPRHPRRLRPGRRLDRRRRGSSPRSSSAWPAGSSSTARCRTATGASRCSTSGSASWPSAPRRRRVAPSLGALIVCRVLWGMGAAAPRSLALAMVRDTLRRRPDGPDDVAHHGDVRARAGAGAGPRLGDPDVRAVADAVLDPGRSPRSASMLLGPPAARDAAARTPPADVAGGAARGGRARSCARRRRSASRIALTCLFGIMTAYVGSSELIIDEVFDRQGPVPDHLRRAGPVPGRRLVPQRPHRRCGVGLLRTCCGSPPCYLVGAAAADGDRRRSSPTAARRCCCSRCRWPCCCRSSPC